MVRAPPSRKQLEQIFGLTAPLAGQILAGAGPFALRAKAAAMSSRLRGVEHNVYEVDFWNLAFWYREA